MKTQLLAIALLFTTLLGFGETPFKCTLKGTVIGRDSKILLLFKSSAQAGPLTPPIAAIAIHNTSFQYTLDVKTTEAYELVFKDEIENGSWMSITFFPINGDVSFTLYPQQENQKDEIIGGKLNADYATFKSSQKTVFDPRWIILNNRQQILEKHNDYYSHLRDSLTKIMMSMSHEKVPEPVYKKLTEIRKTGEEFTANGQKLKIGRDSLQTDIDKWRYKYINAHINPLSYFLMAEDLDSQASHPGVMLLVKEAYLKFAAKFPNHPYTQIVGNDLAALFKLKIGAPLIDFTLPDVAGNKHQLSALAKGKVTLIDFWGSWCGPCIAATNSMFPVYNEFKNKGFNIIGVAREYKTTKDLKIEIKRQKYPWLNLVELNNRNKIWNKYGINDSNGYMVLVDKDGKILALDPTAEEVKKILLASL